jgi:hypothetical protein
MVLQKSHVARIKVKPTILQWVTPEVSESEKPFMNDEDQCDQCDQCDQTQSVFITEKPPKSQGAESTVNKEGLVTESITSQLAGSHGSHESHTDCDFELVDNCVLEIQMGLNKNWSIKRIDENGDMWLCDCPGCSDNNGGNVLTGSIGAIRGHALNHEIVEIQDELERLNDLDLGSLLEELKMCSKDTLQIFQIHVENGSALQHYVLEVLDDIKESRSSTR